MEFIEQLKIILNGYREISKEDQRLLDKFSALGAEDLKNYFHGKIFISDLILNSIEQLIDEYK